MKEDLNQKLSFKNMSSYQINRVFCPRRAPSLHTMKSQDRPNVISGGDNSLIVLLIQA